MAVRVTEVPGEYSLQSAPQAMPTGELLTAPLPFIVTFKGLGSKSKVAVTF